MAGLLRKSMNLKMSCQNSHRPLALSVSPVFTLLLLLSSDSVHLHSPPHQNILFCRSKERKNCRPITELRSITCPAQPLHNSFKLIKVVCVWQTFRYRKFRSAPHPLYIYSLFVSFKQFTIFYIFSNNFSHFCMTTGQNKNNLTD